MSIKPPKAVADVGTTPTFRRTGYRVDLTLNRPAFHNRIEPEDIRALHAYIRQLDEDTTVRVVVITGAGERTFCSGYHIGAFDTEPGPHADEFESLVDAIESMRAITVVKLNGAIFGGAADLALACDFRIGVTHARMQVPAARLGLHFYGHGVRRWVGTLGAQVARRALVAAEAFTAEEMLACGYLTHLATPSSLEATCGGVVEHLATLAPMAVQGMKRVINAAARGEYDNTLAMSQHLACLRSRDFAEGRNAFAEKRTPIFKGL